VILDRGRVLLVKRGHEPLKGEWSLPGGAVDVGEAVEAAVVREVREETCLDVAVGPLIEVVSRITRDASGRVRYHFVILDFLCRATGGTLVCASDAEAAEWASVDDLDRYRLADPAPAVIAKAVSVANGSGPSTIAAEGPWQP
jgi:ADP-ribose pyrophosphatase YjhB (NUDIX family)